MFVVMYRNSDFDRMRRMPNARPWRDGFLIESLRGFSFYALISPDQLCKFVLNAGFSIENRTLNEGSVYLVAKAPARRRASRIRSVSEEGNFKMTFR